MENSVKYSKGSISLFMWKLPGEARFPDQEAFMLLMNHYNFSQIDCPETLVGQTWKSLFQHLHSTAVLSAPPPGTSRHRHKHLDTAGSFCPKINVSRYIDDLKGFPSWNSRTPVCFKVGWSRGPRKHKELDFFSNRFAALPHVCFFLRLVPCVGLGSLPGATGALYSLLQLLILR